MPEPTPALLTDLLGRILQDSAFLYAEPDEEPAAWKGPVLTARIAFEATRGGTLRLLTTPAASAEIAASMLGIEPGAAEADESGSAAVAELLNVLGGTFLTSYFGSAVPSQLGLPVTEIAQPPLPPRRRTCAAAVRLESGAPVVMELDLEVAG